ncbi:hypothetical protein AB395_0000455 [Sinorhizobium fredii CCBAU 45436]|nr:hypothetical protein AB395_0000455 [Sinorhizobium fredii CCBAU 45436]
MLRWRTFSKGRKRLKQPATMTRHRRLTIDQRIIGPAFRTR